jgi:hypothetical protein
MSVRSKIDRQRRRIIKDDQMYLEASARSFLANYLQANEADKELYYHAVSGASAGCQPTNAVAQLDSRQIAEMTADIASRVARQRQQRAELIEDSQQRFITDAFATTAIAYRRAAGTYVDNEKMQQLGTAAVHLLTMATSRMMMPSQD